jgi:hypothetical protein
MICPDCRIPTYPDDEHECGHNEWRIIVRRDGIAGQAVAYLTTNAHEVAARVRDIQRDYKHDGDALVSVQRRWVDGWSPVEHDHENQ